jgi:hypothetical protein
MEGYPRMVCFLAISLLAMALQASCQLVGVTGSVAGVYVASLAYATVAGVKTPSCVDACKKYGFEAVFAGKYTGTEASFYFCSVNFNGEGDRPGYNLYIPGKTGALAGGCTIGYGGKEKTVPLGTCLCSTAKRNTPAPPPIAPGEVVRVLTNSAFSLAVSTATGLSCNDLCKGNGYGNALTAGFYTRAGTPQPAFHHCYIDVNGEGRRPGYNLYKAGNSAAVGGCTVGYGGMEVNFNGVNSSNKGQYVCICSGTTNTITMSQSASTAPSGGRKLLADQA